MIIAKMFEYEKKVASTMYVTRFTYLKIINQFIGQKCQLRFYKNGVLF